METLNRESLSSILSQLPTLIGNYIAMIPEKTLDLRRGPDVWTIREHLYHIAGVQKMLFGRMELIRREEKPEIRRYNPENEPSIGTLYTSVDEALADYRHYRELQLKLLLESTDEELNRKAIHPEYETYTLYMMMHHMVYHEFWHMHRIEEIWQTRDEFFS